MRNLTNAPMYDERYVTPMRQELTQLGVEELRTPEEVDARFFADIPEGDALAFLRGLVNDGRDDGPSVLA